MIDKNTKFSRLVELWFQVFFYSIGITIVFFFLMHYHIVPIKMGISAKQWLTSFTPIIRNSWWYASCYFGLYLLIPIINHQILNSNKSRVVLFIFVSVGLAGISALLYGDGLCIKFGYSIGWLVILYVIGAFIRIHHIKGEWCLLKWGGVILLTWLLSMFLDSTFIYKITGEAKSNRILCLYTSPLILFASVQLFLFFISLNITNSVRTNKYLKRIAVSTFGIYLIHTHDVIWDYFENSLMVKGNIFTILTTVVCACLCVFIICLIIDVVRQFIFSKLNIGSISSLLSNRLSMTYTKFVKRFN